MELVRVLVNIIVKCPALLTTTRFAVGGTVRQALPRAAAGKHGAPGRYHVGTVKPSPDCQLRSGMASRFDEARTDPVGVVQEQARQSSENADTTGEREKIHVRLPLAMGAKPISK